tara:strand:- start:339 stop:491 length:153 start_codon:yes stop_codon:yes gene_type:complete
VPDIQRKVGNKLAIAADIIPEKPNPKGACFSHFPQKNKFQENVEMKAYET